MEKINKLDTVMSILWSSILAGIAIFFGAVIFLAVDNKVVGSALFSIGLYIVCTAKLHLFTGKVCQCLHDKVTLIMLPIIWFGNFIGAALGGSIIHFTRTGTIMAKAQDIWQIKMNDSILSLFLLGIICNIFIFIGVFEYNNNKHEIGKYLGIILSVMGFILVGSEHCVADMAYMAIADQWTVGTLVRLLVITAGNTIGGIFAYEAYRLHKNFSQLRDCKNK